VGRILAAFGAEDHAYVLWEHDEKTRAADGGSEQHFHLVYAHVGDDLLALDDSHSYQKLEAVARTLECDFGESLTPSRRTAAVAARLVEIGREDVAGLLPRPPEPPRSSMTSGMRAAADRKGVDLPAAQAVIRAAWEASDTPQAFTHALVEGGFSLAPGRKEGVFVVSSGDIEVGALDRILKLKRRDVAQRM